MPTERKMTVPVHDLEGLRAVVNARLVEIAALTAVSTVPADVDTLCDREGAARIHHEKVWLARNALAEAELEVKFFHLRRERSALRSDARTTNARLDAAVNAAVSGGRDPTSWLPDELMLAILLMLPFDVLWGGVCERVCMRWRRLMESVPVARAAFLEKFRAVRMVETPQYADPWPFWSPQHAPPYIVRTRQRPLLQRLARINAATAQTLADNPGILPMLFIHDSVDFPGHKKAILNALTGDYKHVIKQLARSLRPLVQSDIEFNVLKFTAEDTPPTVWMVSPQLKLSAFKRCGLVSNDGIVYIFASKRKTTEPAIAQN
jgi:hypothetical protein